jgi:hypothetical protein
MSGWCVHLPNHESWKKTKKVWRTNFWEMMYNITCMTPLHVIRIIWCGSATCGWRVGERRGGGSTLDHCYLFFCFCYVFSTYDSFQHQYGLKIKETRRLERRWSPSSVSHYHMTSYTRRGTKYQTYAIISKFGWQVKA